MGTHARLSPSSAARWTSCTASPAAQDGRPNTTNEASRYGTCGHQLSAECLESGADPQGYLGWTMVFWEGTDEFGNAKSGEDWIAKFENGFPHGGREVARVVVDEPLVEACVKYVNFVRQLVRDTGGHLIVEQQVPIGHITGETDARGTSDVVILTGDTLITVDAKFGRGRVNAYDVIEDATYDPITEEAIPPKLRMNLQLALYLLGAYEKHGLMVDFTKCKAIIVQPFLNHVSEYGCAIEELFDLGDWLKARAEDTRKRPEFKPTGDNCFFCKAKFDCHARSVAVLSTCLDGFEDVETARPKPVSLPKLGSLYDKLQMIRDWCDDIEQKTMEELLAGRPVMRADGMKFKIVEGKKGHKAWTEPETVERMLKDMRLKDELIYKKTLITPAVAEKLAEKKGKRPDPNKPKKPIGKIHWSRLEELITQPDGKPTIALQTDPRPVYVIKADGFGDVTPTDNSDLF